MASTSRLTVYTKSSPPAYGPLALASHITQASGTENVISIEYEEKSEDPNEICRLDSGRCVALVQEAQESIDLSHHADEIHIYFANGKC